MLGPVLPGARGVTLRPTTEDEYRSYRDWAGRPENTRFWPPRAGEWTDAQLDDGYVGEASGSASVLWTIALDAEPVGLAWLQQIDWVRRQAEVVLLVGSHERHGQGIGTEALRLQIEYAFTHLNLRRLFSRSIDENAAIQRANARLGLERIGTASQNYRLGPLRFDESIFELLRGHSSISSERRDV